MESVTCLGYSRNQQLARVRVQRGSPLFAYMLTHTAVARPGSRLNPNLGRECIENVDANNKSRPRGISGVRISAITRVRQGDNMQ